MIRIFGQSETDFSTNGDCVLMPIKAVVHQYQNSDFYLELEASLDYVPWFEQGRLVVADYMNTQQTFRMWNVVKMKNRVKATCLHVFFDLKYRIIPPLTLDEGYHNPYQFNSIYNLLRNAYDPRIFDPLEEPAPYGVGGYTVVDYAGGSQFDDTFYKADFFRGHSTYDIIQNIMEMYYPCELVIDNFRFGIKYLTWDVEEREFQIRYGKNLKDITKEEDWSEVCTHLFAIGKDGLTGEFQSTTQYAYPYVKIVEFQQDEIVADNYNSESAYKAALSADLAKQAQAYLNAHCVPQIEYTVSAHIGKYEYGEYAGLPEVLLGDEIDVIDETLGINVRTKVIGIDYDINTETYESVTFGNYVSSMKGYNRKVEEAFDNLKVNTTLYTYPVGSEYVTYSNIPSPNYVGIDGCWELVSQSGVKKVFKRTA